MFTFICCCIQHIMRWFMTRLRDKRGSRPNLMEERAPVPPMTGQCMQTRRTFQCIRRLNRYASRIIMSDGRHWKDHTDARLVEDVTEILVNALSTKLVSDQRPCISCRVDELRVLDSLKTLCNRLRQLAQYAPSAERRWILLGLIEEIEHNEWLGM